MTLDALYTTAFTEGVEVCNVQLYSTKSISVMANSGNCYIAIDTKQLKSDAEHKVILAHELGHCKRGAFYNRYSRLDVVSRHEYRADRQAVLDLIPYDELMAALRNGIIEVWQLAEYFEVTEDFMCRTIEHYMCMGYQFTGEVTL